MAVDLTLCHCQINGLYKNQQYMYAHIAIIIELIWLNEWLLLFRVNERNNSLEHTLYSTAFE